MQRHSEGTVKALFQCWRLVGWSVSCELCAFVRSFVRSFVELAGRSRVLNYEPQKRPHVQRQGVSSDLSERIATVWTVSDTEVVMAKQRAPLCME